MADDGTSSSSVLSPQASFWEEQAQEVTHDQEKPAKSYPGNLVQESTKGLFGTQKGCKAGPPMCAKTGYKRPFELREG